MMAALSLLYLKRIVKKSYFELRTLELVSNLRTSTVYLRKGLQAQLEEITPSLPEWGGFILPNKWF